jgi:anti-anti-sigma factor
MELTRHQTTDGLEVRVSGRLDAYWADHFAAALDEVVRAGAHRIELNLSAVTYLSSAGISALVRLHKQLGRIQGGLRITSPSEPVYKVLEVSGLLALLAVSAPAAAAGAAAPSVDRIERESATFELFECGPAAPLTCRLVGDSCRLAGCRFGVEDCRTARFPESSFGLGLGALGDGFADCRGRFGEFLAAAGAVAYLPTDGTNVPDYLLAHGQAVPEVQVCYALTCDGRPGRTARFEARTGAGAVPLSELAEVCLQAAGADAAGVVLVAESAGLVGAALRRSPALGGADGGPFGFPGVRDWLTFTAERAFARSLALVVGVAARGDGGPLAPLVRPLGPPPAPAGHFHAAAFSYHPLPKGAIELGPTVATLFGGQVLEGVLHLLADGRPIVGIGESEFVRGACWIGPIAAVAREGD